MLKLPLLLALTLLSQGLRAEPPCDAQPAGLLAIGASQTGATWARSYFGNFFQQCLKEDPRHGKSFVIYGRGGTRPDHWLNSAGMDKIATVQRDPDHNHLNLGADDAVPFCKKRLGAMLEAHGPERVLIFFGDNLLTMPESVILSQYGKLLDEVEKAGVRREDCWLLAPTFEMEVTEKRNVPWKNLENTLLVNAGIKKAAEGRCNFIDGLDLMRESPYLLSNNLLKRVQGPGMSGCLGASGNDNIHICGEAARDFALRVCARLSQ